MGLVFGYTTAHIPLIIYQFRGLVFFQRLVRLNLLLKPFAAVNLENKASCNSISGIDIFTAV